MANMRAEETDAGVAGTGRSLLTKVAEVFRYRSSWKTTPTVPEDLEARLRVAPPEVDALFIDAVINVERPQVDDNPRAIAALMALAVRLTPAARRGLLTLATRAREMDGDSSEYETLARGVDLLARDFMPEVVEFIASHPGDLGGLPEMVVRKERLNAALLEVLLARLEDNPRSVAFVLGYFEDPRVLPALTDRLARLAPEDTLEWASALSNLAEVVVELGGKLSKDQKADRKRAEESRAAWWEQQNREERALRERAEEARTSQRRFRLEELARDPSSYIRALVANNRSTGEATLATLAGDASIDVRSAVASNTSACEATLALLAQDADADVRGAVADNPITPERLQIALATDPAQGVRVALARCEDVYPSACVLLLEDKDPAVRKGIVATVPVTMLVGAVADPAPEVRSVVAGRTDLTLAQFEVLASDPDPNVRLVVAFNEKAPAAALERLVNDDNPTAREHAKERLAKLAAAEAAASAPWTDEELPEPPEEYDEMG